MTEKDDPPYYPKKWIMLALVVVVMWGLVPTLAVIADLTGGFTTMVVNLFATVGVVVIMAFNKRLWKLRPSDLKAKYIGISIVWPLGYSLGYFTLISLSNGSMATISNYMWPVVALVILKMLGHKIPNSALIAGFLGSLVVATMVVLEQNGSQMSFEGMTLVFVVFFILVPLTQATFNVVTSDTDNFPEEDAWTVTLIGAIVTTIGSFIYVWLFENGNFGQVESINQLLPLAIVGIGGNSIGFFAFLRGGQMAETANQKAKYGLIMYLVPVAQVIFLVFGIKEEVSFYRVGAFIAIAVILAVQHFVSKDN